VIREAWKAFLKRVSEFSRLVSNKADWKPCFSPFKKSFSKALTLLLLVAGIEAGIISFYVQYMEGQRIFSSALGIDFSWESVDFKENIDRAVTELGNKKLTSVDPRPFDGDLRYDEFSYVSSYHNREILEAKLNLRIFEEIWGINSESYPGLVRGYVSESDLHRLISKVEDIERLSVLESFLTGISSKSLTYKQKNNTGIAMSRFHAVASKEDVLNAFENDVIEQSYERQKLRYIEDKYPVFEMEDPILNYIEYFVDKVIYLPTHEWEFAKSLDGNLNGTKQMGFGALSHIDLTKYINMASLEYRFAKPFGVLPLAILFGLSCGVIVGLCNLLLFYILGKLWKGFLSCISDLATAVKGGRS
tara:strand:+ start:204 stop:1286 length:1083 start_codon:yes stop_codon:yes gene_type:complete